MATYFKRPFAQDGLKTTIPIDTTIDGSVSFQKGWGTDYELDPIVDPTNAKFPEMRVFNKFFHDVSDNIKEWQQQTFPTWISDKGDGTPYVYSKDAIVTYIDSRAYISLVNSNNGTPTIDTNEWQLLEEYIKLNISTLTAKTTPIDADTFVIADSASSNVLKKLTWANLKATLLSSFGAMINTATTKTTLIDDDIFIIGDSNASNASKKTTWANLKATLFNGSMSLATNGYIKFPTVMGGLIIQWGAVTTALAPKQPLIVTMPIAFTTNCFYKNASTIETPIPDNSATAVQARYNTLTTINFFNDDTDSSQKFNWLAIGH